MKSAFTSKGQQQVFEMSLSLGHDPHFTSAVVYICLAVSNNTVLTDIKCVVMERMILYLQIIHASYYYFTKHGSSRKRGNIKRFLNSGIDNGYVYMARAEN